MSKLSLFGKLIRLPLKLLPESMVVPFLYGDLKGFKWITGSSNNGYWLGLYEKSVKRELKGLINEGDVFYDLGAHVGYFSLVGSKLVGESGKVYSFEPLPSNLDFLKRHLKMNGIKNVEVFENAVAHFEGSFKMENRSRVGAKLSDSGSLEVKVISLKNYLDSGRLPIPNMIKMDIEGEEQHLIPDLADYLTKNKIHILLSTHGKDTHNKCLKDLKEMGYTFKPLDAEDLQSCTELLALKK